MSTLITFISNNNHCTDELSITVTPFNQTVSEGGVAVFTPTATGIKTRPFEYEWWKFSSGQQSVMVGRNRRLRIQNVKIKDGGSYYCIVTNEWGNKISSKKVNLTVTGKTQN